MGITKKRIHMKNFLLFFVLFLASVISAQAHQGCCSWHGGVCGCQCCDGSSFSDKCAPYYPECSTNNNINEQNDSNST